MNALVFVPQIHLHCKANVDLFLRDYLNKESRKKGKELTFEDWRTICTKVNFITT